jgi:rhodanese-related sulfurtransferase
MGFIKNLFGLGAKTDFKSLVKTGATIVDVRINTEYHTGHIKNSLNIPLHELPSSLDKIDRSKPVITCCASGIRSGSAVRILKKNGYTNVHNGGGWSSLLFKIRG